MIIKKPENRNAYTLLSMTRTYFPYVSKNLEKIKNEMNDEKNIFRIATDKKKVIAFIHAKNHKNKIFILGLATLPEYRNKGIAGKLIKKISDEFKKPLMLIVEEENSSAIKLYEKLGFAKKGYSKKTLYGKRILRMRLERSICNKSS